MGSKACVEWQSRRCWHKTPQLWVPGRKKFSSLISHDIWKIGAVENQKKDISRGENFSKTKGSEKKKKKWLSTEELVDWARVTMPEYRNSLWTEIMVVLEQAREGWRQGPRRQQTDYLEWKVWHSAWRLKASCRNWDLWSVSGKQCTFTAISWELNPKSFIPPFKVSSNLEIEVEINLKEGIKWHHNERSGWPKLGIRI